MNHFINPILLTKTAVATGLIDSTLFKGAMNLLNDATTAATLACPILAGLCAIVFVARRSMADEQDGKLWSKRITIAITCGVGGMLVSGVIALLTSYFV